MIACSCFIAPLNRSFLLYDCFTKRGSSYINPKKEKRAKNGRRARVRSQYDRLVIRGLSHITLSVEGKGFQMITVDYGGLQFGC